MNMLKFKALLSAFFTRETPTDPVKTLESRKLTFVLIENLVNALSENAGSPIFGLLFVLS